MRSVRLRVLAVLTAISIVSGIGAAPPVATARVPADAVVRLEERPLPFFYDLYTFRGEGGRTAVVAAFAVEAGRLETDLIDSRTQYRFSVSLVLADRALRTVSDTHDTVFVDLPARLPEDHLLYTHVEVLARPAANIEHRLLMMDATTPGIGQLYREHGPIPDYSGDALMLSDIALGQPDARTGWTWGNATLALLPTSQFPSSAFDVFYEVYNLPGGHSYTTEIAVERTGRGVVDTEPIRLRFAGQSSAGPDKCVAELRRVETSLPRGSYRITVTITDTITGETASRSRPFEVRGTGRGATMVPAVPLRPERRPGGRP